MGGYPENGKNGQIDEGGIMGYVCPPYIQIKKEEEFSPMVLSAGGVYFYMFVVRVVRLVRLWAFLIYIWAIPP